MKPDEDQEEMLVTYTLMQKKRPLTKYEEDLAVSSEYDRRIYDSPSARREFHISGRPVLQFSNRSRTNGWYTFLCTVHQSAQSDTTVFPF